MKWIIIIAAALAVTLIVFFIVIPKVKRSKLAEAWADQLKLMGQTTVTKEQIKEELKVLSNSEIDKLIDWSKKLQAKDIAGAALMMKDVGTIISKVPVAQKLIG